MATINSPTKAQIKDSQTPFVDGVPRNTIATPVAQGSSSQQAGIVGYGSGGAAIYGPTTLSSDMSKTIAQNNATFQQLQDKGVRTDPTTNTSTYADGTIKNPPQQYDTSNIDGQIGSLFDQMRDNTDAMSASSIAGIQARFANARQQQQQINESQMAGTRSALLMSGAMKHDVFSDDNIAVRAKQGLQNMIDLDNQENDLIMQVKAAQLEKNNRIVEQRINELKEVRKRKLDETTKLNDDLREEEKKVRETEMKVKTEDAITKLYQSGLTETTAIARKLTELGYKTPMKDVSDTVALISGIGGTGIVGEYNFYKADAIRRGQIPLNFDEYQTRDANRKVSLAKAGTTQYGGYDTVQEKVIDKINTSVSNNPSYKKYVAMQTYANNVEAGLSQGSGIGDIAAINQFQKVIDEGAVTRDQDVKLISGAQSLASSLNTQIKKLQKGDQLSLNQRQQMLTLTQQMIETQKKAMEKDPGVIAQKKKADRFQIDINETALGEFGGEDSLGTSLIKEEESAESALNNYISRNPHKETEIENLTTELENILGRHVNASEFLSKYPQYK